MKTRFDVVIAGGGVLGSSIALELARSGVTDVCVVDVDLAHRRTSFVGRWPVRTTWTQPLHIDMARASLESMRAWGDSSFEATGHLWLAGSAAAESDFGAWMRPRAAACMATEVLSPSELGKRFPLLERSSSAEESACLVPGDGAVDPQHLCHRLRARAAECGVQFLDSVYLEGLTSCERQPGRRRLETLELLRMRLSGDGAPPDEILRSLQSHGVATAATAGSLQLRPGIVINALGAWSSLLRVKLGSDNLCRPHPRQLSVLSLVGYEGRGVEGVWPGLIADARGAFFFADSAYTVAGAVATGPRMGFDYAYAGEGFFQDSVWPLLATRSEAFERVHHLRGTVCMEAVTPDGSGVVGDMPGYTNVFEAFGFPGGGVSLAFAVARGLAERIAQGRYESLDLSPLHADRFERAAWLPEPISL